MIQFMKRQVVRTLCLAVVATIGGLALSASPAFAISLSDCSGTGGSWRGTETGNLSNGELQAGFCVDVVSGARRTTVQYVKTSGGTVTLRFGWQIINSASTAVKSTFWDQGAFTQSAGQTKYFRFEYPSVQPKYDSTYECGRGIMRDQNTQITYFTKLVCNM